MPIPFGLSADQFAARFRGLLEKHSPALIRELREVLAMPIGEGVTSAHIEIFLNADGEFGPGVGMYFDGENKKVDHADRSIFPGRHLPIGEYLHRLPAFDPRYYSDYDFGALSIQGDVCKTWFAEWWWKAGGWSYPLKVDIDVHDGYGDGNGILLAPGS
jgi:hypothetical protein